MNLIIAQKRHLNSAFHSFQYIGLVQCCWNTSIDNPVRRSARLMNIIEAFPKKHRSCQDLYCGWCALGITSWRCALITIAGLIILILSVKKAVFKLKCKLLQLLLQLSEDYICSVSTYCCSSQIATVLELPVELTALFLSNFSQWPTCACTRCWVG